MIIQLCILSLSLFVTGIANAIEPHFDNQSKIIDKMTNVSYMSGTDTLSEKMSKSINSPDKRAEAQRQAALSWGAQYGYVSFLNYLKDKIIEKSDQYDALFDFNTLMKLATVGENDIFLLPAIITEANDLATVSRDAKSIRISGKVWFIHKPEMLVLAAPNWRQYLLYDSEIDISEPPSVLMPKPDEKARWRKWFIEGYYAGVDQADREMERRAYKLDTDFNGRAKYKRLVNDGKIIEPKLIASVKAISGTDNQMTLRDKYVEIVRPTKMNFDSSKWQHIITDDRQSLRTPEELEHINQQALLEQAQ
ncbi:type IV secretory system conjugative DNA transfer family protein [Vibrio splendidus]